MEPLIEFAPMQTSAFSCLDGGVRKNPFQAAVDDDGFLSGAHVTGHVEELA